MKNKMVYLDYASTTPVDPRIVDKMVSCLTLDGNFGNPASRTHSFGWNAATIVKNATEQASKLINADPGELIWTSGATESDNLAIKGVAYFHQKKGKHIITSATEHKAVLDTCKYLSEKDGFEITYIKPKSNGLIDISDIDNAIRKDTILISIMHVNNEIGVIQDIEAISALAQKHEIIFHSDAAQSTGKIPIDLKKLPIDLMSFSGHKIYGPKGIGLLFVRQKPRVRLEAQIHGGGHQKGLRSGTLPTHLIAGVGEAFRLAQEEIELDSKRMLALKNRLWNGIKDIEVLRLNSDPDHSISNILNVSFNYIEGESLIMALKDIAVSTGSACTSASLESSYVLRALGVSDELAHSSIRFSFGRFTTEEEIDFTANLLRQKVAKLRDMSPLWEMYKKGIDVNNYKWVDHH